MKTRYKYIHFECVPTPPTRKTAIFYCHNINIGAILGVVRWHSSWRQYCFMPKDFTVFSRSCLADVQHFIQQLMDERE